MRGIPVLVVLPPVAFALTYCYLVGGGSKAGGGLRRSFVLAAVALGAYLTISTELLSLANGISAVWVASAWVLPIIGLTIAVAKTRAHATTWVLLVGRLKSATIAERAFVGALALVCGVLFFIAIVSPPNTYDSALYHMTRVVHWAQNASLKPYPALVEHQLHKPIWAETAILHLRTLWGSDRPAGLVQWFSMLGSLVAVSGITALLRGGRGAQILAAAFCASIPMGILQASSTQNDYVAAFWAVCLAFLVVLSVRRELTLWELGGLAAATGLGALTKGTFFVYAPPFLAWFFLHEWAARGLRKAFRGALLVGLITLILNAGYWGRNMVVFGGPYGSSNWLHQAPWMPSVEQPKLLPAADQVGPDGGLTSTPAPSGEAAPAATALAVKAAAQIPSVVQDYLVGLAQTAGRNLTVPTGFLTQRLVAALANAPGVYGEDYAREMRSVAWNHEDSAGSPIHLLFVPLTLAVLLIGRIRADRKLGLGYAVVALIAYAMIPIVIGHGASLVGIRYQLSFFVLWAPVVGATLGSIGSERLWRWLAAAFLLATIPWLLLNRSRPLVGLPPDRTWVGSILTEPQETLLLPWNGALVDDYVQASRAVAESGCKDVELRANAAYEEYPLWWLLDAPQSGIRIEVRQVSPYLKRFIDPQFEPCAVICANCDVQQTQAGLPLFGTYDSFKVYLAQ